MDLLEIFTNFDAEDWSWFIRGLLIIIPTSFSFRYYYRYRITEYLIFGIYWLIAAIGSLAYPFILSLDILILWQLQESSILWFFFVLVLHSVRVRWSDTSPYFRSILVSILIFALILQIIIIAWQPMFQTTGVELFWETEANPTYRGNGAGVVTSDGIIVYSTGHTILRDVFAFFASLLFFYAYWTVKPFNPTRRIKKAYRIWRISVFLTLINFSILTVLWRINDMFFIIGGVTALLALILVAGITIYFPEAFLLSSTQVNRIIKLYEIARNQRLQRDFGFSADKPLIEYLDSTSNYIDKMEDL